METVKKICGVVIIDWTARNWFVKFHPIDATLKDETRAGSPFNFRGNIGLKSTSIDM